MEIKKYRLHNIQLAEEIRKLKEEKVSSIEERSKKLKPAEVPRTRKGKKVEEKPEESGEVTQLRAELKEIKEKYRELQVEDKKHRSHLTKEIYKVETLLYDTRSRLRRVNPLRKQVENLYLQNWILRTRNKKLKEKVNQGERRVETGILDMLVQVALR